MKLESHDRISSVYNTLIVNILLQHVGFDTAENEPRQICWIVNPNLASRDLGSFLSLRPRAQLLDPSLPASASSVFPDVGSNRAGLNLRMFPGLRGFAEWR